MSKLKLVGLIVVIGSVLVGGLLFVNQLLAGQDQTTNQPDQCRQLETYTLCYDQNRTVQVVVFEGELGVSFSAKEAASLEEQANLKGYALAINGTYFSGSYVKADHSGLLQLAGERLYQIAYNDTQLTHVVVYNVLTQGLQFLPVQGFDLEKYQGAQYTLFQTGPLVIKDNAVQSAAIQNSINGAGRYFRTLLGQTSTGEKFFVVTRTNYDLNKLAEKILAFDVLKGRVLNVINLDGGTSTSMYVRDLDEFNFGASKRLPSVIGIK